MTNSRRLSVSRYSISFTKAGVIWTFWDGNPPPLVLRCIESMRAQNPNRPVVVVSKSTLPIFLDDEDDYPTFDGRPGTPDDFSSPQYLSDWVRLTLLAKYGGVWFDASVICTNPVETWMSRDPSKITMFPMHANPNVHGNWTMASPTPGHPLLLAWRDEMARVMDQAGPCQVPTQFCEDAFVEYPALDNLWNKPSPPPLPYLWVYLVLQVVLQQDPTLHDTIDLKPSIDGPMYRRYLYNVQQGVTDAEELSDCVANDLATQPMGPHDYAFIKLVGKDRAPCQDRLEAAAPGTALAFLRTQKPRAIAYGCNLQDRATNDALVAMRNAVRTVSLVRRSTTLVREQRKVSQRGVVVPLL